MSASNSFKPLLFPDGKVRLTYLGFSKAMLKCDANGVMYNEKQAMTKWHLTDLKTITPGIQFIFGVSDITLQNPAPIVISFDLQVDGLLGKTILLMGLMSAAEIVTESVKDDAGNEFKRLNVHTILDSLSGAVGLVFKAKLHSPNFVELWEIDPNTIEPYLQNGVQVRDKI